MSIEYSQTTEQMIIHSAAALRIQTAKAQQFERALQTAEAQLARR